VVATRGQLRRAIASYVGDALAEQITALYPSDEFRLPSDAWIAFLGEATFICPGLSAAAAASGGAPSYTYHFTRAPLISRAIGVAHGTELLYVFGTFDRVLLTPSRTDERVIESMQRAWTSFANFGAPVLSSGWPRYAPAGAQIALLDEPTSITTQIRGGRCAALQRLGVVP
jgi:para-nitrobenzyl esterase